MKDKFKKNSLILRTTIMKQKMKTIFKVFTLILLMTFSSCNEDLYESQIQQNESKFLIRELSKSDVEQNVKLTNELNKIQNFKSKIVASKMVYDPVYDFFVSTDEALYISDGVSESYTFPVYRASSNSVLENLVIHIQNQQTLVYLVDYGYSLSQLQNMTKTQLEQNDVKHYLIELNTNSILNGKLDVPRQEQVCSETYVSNPLYGNCTETHSNGYTCQQQEFILQSTSCQWITTGGGGGLTDSGTSGTGTTGSGPTGGSTNTGSNVSSGSVTINTTFVECTTCLELTSGFSNFLSNLPNNLLSFWNSNSLDLVTKKSILNYLDQNNYSTDSAQFITELFDLACQELVIDVNAINFVLQGRIQDKFENDLNEAFLISVDQYVDLNTSDPIITQQLITYFSVKCAILRHQNPSWSNTKIYWEASKDLIHVGLDIFGLVPLIGELADLTNGVLYTIEGDGVNATLSYASSIPLVGWATASTKLALKVVNSSQTAYTVSTKVKLVWKIVGNTVTFGDRSQLRKVLGMGSSAVDPRQAHHIIPWNKQSKEIVQKAAKSSNAFHMNEALNGIPLSTAAHNGSHANYDNVIQIKFDEFNRDFPNATPVQCYSFLTNLIQQIKTWIANNPNTPINNIILP